MCKTKFQTIITILCLVLSSMAFNLAKAVPVKNLYTAEVPVSSQGAAVRQKAIRQAFQGVLIKVSGNLSVIEVSGIQEQMAHINDFMKQYSYVSMPENERSTANNRSPSLLLRVQFDSKAVNRLLLTTRQDILGDNRPLILVWVVMDTPNGLQMLGSDSTNQVVTLLRTDAERRGMPLLFPLLDLADLKTVTAEQVWQNKLSAVSDASARYTKDAVAVLLIHQLQGQWQGDWFLRMNQQQFHWTINADALPALVSNGIDDLTSNIAARFAILGSGDKAAQVTVRVSNVIGAENFAAALSYLRNLAPVDQVQVKQINKSSVLFSVKLMSDQLSLVQSIGLGNKLTALPSPQNGLQTVESASAQGTTNQQNVGLNYRWNS